MTSFYTYNSRQQERAEAFLDDDEDAAEQLRARRVQAAAAAALAASSASVQISRGAVQAAALAVENDVVSARAISCNTGRFNGSLVAEVSEEAEQTQSAAVQAVKAARRARRVKLKE